MYYGLINFNAQFDETQTVITAKNARVVWNISKLIKMMQSDRLLAHFSHGLHVITLPAIILALLFPFRQLECVLDIQDRVHSWKTWNLCQKMKIFVYLYRETTSGEENISVKFKFMNFLSYFWVKFLSPWLSVMRFYDLRIKIIVFVNLLFLS